MGSDPNVWLFVPLGCLMYKVFVPRGKSAVSAILYCVGLSLVIECTQAILHIGWCTLSDLISNSLGSMIGVIIGYLARPDLSTQTRKSTGGLIP